MFMCLAELTFALSDCSFQHMLEVDQVGVVDMANCAVVSVSVPQETPDGVATLPNLKRELTGIEYHVPLPE
jgi:hypothetical protein